MGLSCKYVGGDLRVYWGQELLGVVSNHSSHGITQIIEEVAKRASSGAPITEVHKVSNKDVSKLVNKGIAIATTVLRTVALTKRHVPDYSDSSISKAASVIIDRIDIAEKRGSQRERKICLAICEKVLKENPGFFDSSKGVKKCIEEISSRKIEE